MKCKKLILHIGVHKTGTTAIQTFLYENREVFRKRGFFVPDFIHSAKNKPGILRDSIRKKRKRRTRAYLQEMVVHAKENACHTVILSDEDFSKTNEDDLGHVKFFAEFFEEIEVLMYCRRPDRQSESGYAFCVMWEGSKYRGSPDQWYMKNPGNDYYRHASYYRETLPGCRIKAVSYDFNVKRLIPSFIEACGMEARDYILPEKDQSNISANKYMVEVMNEINQFAISDRVFCQVRAEITQHEKLQDGPKAIFFSDKQRRLNQNRVEPRMKRFIEEFHGGEPLFDPFLSIPVPRGLDEREKAAIVSELVCKYKLKDEFGPLERFKRVLKDIWRRGQYKMRRWKNRNEM